jgi:hypothetical protein
VKAAQLSLIEGIQVKTVVEPSQQVSVREAKDSLLSNNDLRGHVVTMAALEEKGLKNLKGVKVIESLIIGPSNIRGSTNIFIDKCLKNTIIKIMCFIQC